MYSVIMIREKLLFYILLFFQIEDLYSINSCNLSFLLSLFKFFRSYVYLKFTRFVGFLVSMKNKYVLNLFLISVRQMIEAAFISGTDCQLELSVCFCFCSEFQWQTTKSLIYVLLSLKR